MEKLLKLFTIISSLLTPSQLPNLWHDHLQHHFLRPQSAVGLQDTVFISCSSGRLAVETNNLIEWATVPKECELYVGSYMLGQHYRQDSAMVIEQAISYAESLNLTGDGKDVWVFDIDETTLSNLPYIGPNGFGTNPSNATAAEEWAAEAKAPALPESLRFYKKLLSLGIKVVFLTGRFEWQRNVTTINLQKVGYSTWLKLILRSPKEANETALVYKSSERKKLEKEGYHIVGNMGDQWSDLLGTNIGKRTFKLLPNPMYYVS